jgi:hypothetical protein
VDPAYDRGRVEAAPGEEGGLDARFVPMPGWPDTKEAVLKTAIGDGLRDDRPGAAHDPVGFEGAR